MAKTVKKEEKKEVGKAEELRAQVIKAREELAGLVMDNIQHKLKNTSSLRTKRDQIARLLTALRQVEMEAATK
jgi:ribosomal protein L29